MESKPSKSFAPLILVLNLVGACISLILVLRSYGSTLGEGFCVVGELFNCNSVTQSDWAYIFGISWSQYGLWFYSTWFCLSFLWVYIKKYDLNVFHTICSFLSAISLVVSCYLFLVSKLVLKAYCPYCIALYVVNILLLFVCVASGFSFKKVLVLPKTLLGEINQPQTKTILVAFLLGILITVIAPIVWSKWFQTKATPVARVKLSNLFIDDGVMGDYWTGSSDAPIEIVKFSDLQCPYCRWYSKVIDKFLVDYKGKLRVVFKNYPLDSKCNKQIKNKFHILACDAAEFARCAGEQGVFWRVLHDLYQLPILEKEGVKEQEFKLALKEYAKKTGLDTVGLQECLDSDRQLARIKADIEQGQQFGIKGTPTLFINGVLQSDIKYKSIKKAIDDLL